MQEKGLNTHELIELKAAILKAERLEILALLRDMDSKEQAIEALEQRLQA